MKPLRDTSASSLIFALALFTNPFLTALVWYVINREDATRRVS